MGTWASTRERTNMVQRWALWLHSWIPIWFPSATNYHPLERRTQPVAQGSTDFSKSYGFFCFFFLTKKILISQYVIEIRTLGPTSWVLMDFFKKLPFFLITKVIHIWSWKLEKNKIANWTRLKLLFKKRVNFIVCKWYLNKKIKIENPQKKSTPQLNLTKHLNFHLIFFLAYQHLVTLQSYCKHWFVLLFYIKNSWVFLILLNDTNPPQY